MTRISARIALAALGIATFVAVLVIGASWLSEPRRHETSYFARGALPPLTAIPVTETDYPARGIRCIQALGLSHRRMDGTHIVLTDRAVLNPQLLTSDDEEYEMLSVELPDDLIGHRIGLPSPDVQLRYSRGSLYGTHRCIGQIATEARGSLVTERIGDKLKVFVDVDLLLQQSGRDGVPAPFRLGREIIASNQPADATDIFDEMLQHVAQHETPDPR
ncbi:MAG: hypothetical protein AB7N70_40155 [Dehalococcoidia bacterium]